MIKNRLIGIFVCCVLFLTACGLPLSEQKQADNPAINFTKEMVGNIRVKNILPVRTALKPELNTDATAATLLEMSKHIHADKPIKSIDLADYRYTTTKSAVDGSSMTRTVVVLQYQFEGVSPVMVSALLNDAQAPFEIETLNFTNLPQTLQEKNGFSLKGKSIEHIAFLFVTVGVFILNIYAFIQCLRTPKFKRKWLWAIFTLIGIVSVSLNWVTGELNIQPIAVQLFSAAFAREGLLGAWTISCAFPLGALLFLKKRAGLLSKSKESSLNE